MLAELLTRLRAGHLGVGDAGQIALSEHDFRHPRSVQSRLVNGAGEIGDEHAAAVEVQRDTDAFVAGESTGFRTFAGQLLGPSARG